VTDSSQKKCTFQEFFRNAVRIGFALGTDFDAAANDIREFLSRVVGRLPDDVARRLSMSHDIFYSYDSFDSPALHHKEGCP
jgi:hypothetical protein